MHFRTECFVAALIGYLLTIHVYQRRWTEQSLESIRPLLDSGATHSGGSRRGRRIAGAAGLGILFAVIHVVPNEIRIFADPDYYIFEHVWGLATVPVIGWLSGTLAYQMVIDGRMLSRLATEVGHVDLLDLEPLAPFARHGLRNALIWTLYMSIGGLHLMSPGTAPAVLLIALLSLTVAITALVVPMLGIHRRIREEKRRRLRDLREHIRADEARLEAESPGESTARLPALLALEARVHGVHEWPFDTSSLLRFGFYIALGLGSWLGAAMVERLVGSALDS
jgi:hypothetical protein